MMANEETQRPYRCVFSFSLFRFKIENAYHLVGFVASSPEGGTWRIFEEGEYQDLVKPPFATLGKLFVIMYCTIGMERLKENVVMYLVHLLGEIGDEERNRIRKSSRV